ncbi:B-box zinc finger protein 20-like protein isoform X1 [Cinnamomum micranthum f. kanehirae]|uniref:B-box zinc finger protein 20-like protein isoform X1 n=1 Tax=Cinnamomum micranthum f. kanehirae TaxID=337451 RepID=A0A3S3QJ47_9MAGN|nr:B-box zinc finger protein 20-like protein isoform X1 [Cinnamomum micranthum f. kanehirae]
MKIQCDVCHREEASVFCSADEAALCYGCDSRVHRANKLSSKHHRFSLLHPSLRESPRCDICQERRAFLFCQEDRAILCRECDLPIHTANHLTQKHNRFLLTGIKLSSPFSPISSHSDESTHQTIQDDHNSNKEEDNKKEEASTEMGSSLPVEKMANAFTDSSQGSKTEDLCTSSISEYLMETLPGWHVEDLLASSAPVEGLCETDGFSDLGLASNDFSIWVPQVPPISGLIYPSGALDTRNEVGSKDFKERRWNEDGLSVPEMRPTYKRARPFW